MRNVVAAFQGDWGNVGRGFTTAKFGTGTRIEGIGGCRNSFKTWGKMRGIYARRNVGRARMYSSG